MAVRMDTVQKSSTRPAALGEGSAVSRSRLAALVPTVAAIVVFAVCIAAGNWQRGRMHEKEALGQQLQAAVNAPVVPLPVNPPDWQALRFRTVSLRGSFVAQRQFLLDNRVHGGVVGFEVVAPLRTDDGRMVLVNRGFVPGGPS